MRQAASCFRVLFASLALLAAAGVTKNASAEQVTTTPLQFYGLGTLNCAAWSPDGARIVTGGSMGALLWNVAKSGVVPPISITLVETAMLPRQDAPVNLCCSLFRLTAWPGSGIHPMLP